MKSFLAAAILLLQATDAERAEAALAKFGTHTYRLSEKGQKLGTWIMKSRLEKTGDRKLAVFEDEVDVAMGEQKLKMSLKESAALVHYRLLSAKQSGRGADWTVSVSGTKAVMNVQGREQTIEITETTVGERGVLRLICAAEQKAKASLKADVLSMTAERLEKDHLFQCSGKEEVEIGGKKIDAFKWKETWEWKGTVNGVPASSRVDNTYWVSPEGYLVRAGGPEGVELVLEPR